MQRPTLTERMILAPPKEGAKYEVSLPPLEPESQGQHAPGTKDLVPVLGLRPQTSILRAGKAGEALFKAPEGHSPGPVSYTHLTLPTTRTSCRSRWSPYH